MNTPTPITIATPYGPRTVDCRVGEFLWTTDGMLWKQDVCAWEPVARVTPIRRGRSFMLDFFEAASDRVYATIDARADDEVKS